MKPRHIRLDSVTLSDLALQRILEDRKGHHRLATRIQAVMLNHDGLTSGQISRRLQVPLSRVSEWLKRYEACGYQGLQDQPRSGRPARITGQQLRELSDMIQAGPGQQGLLCTVWYSDLLGAAITRQFDVQYHLGHVRRLRCQLGCAVQRRRKRWRAQAKVS